MVYGRDVIQPSMESPKCHLLALLSTCKMQFFVGFNRFNRQKRRFNRHCVNIDAINGTLGFP